MTDPIEVVARAMMQFGYPRPPVKAIRAAIAAIQQAEPDVEAMAQQAMDEVVRLEGERENGPFVFSYAAVEAGIRAALAGHSAHKGVGN